MLLFVADNLACFPYLTQEEPLFIMHHIDITLSISGSNLLQSFKEVGTITPNAQGDNYPLQVACIYRNFHWKSRTRL